MVEFFLNAYTPVWKLGLFLILLRKKSTFEQVCVMLVVPKMIFYSLGRKNKSKLICYEKRHHVVYFSSFCGLSQFGLRIIWLKKKCINTISTYIILCDLENVNEPLFTSFSNLYNRNNNANLLWGPYTKMYVKPFGAFLNT